MEVPTLLLFEILALMTFYIILGVSLCLPLNLSVSTPKMKEKISSSKNKFKKASQSYKLMGLFVSFDPISSVSFPFQEMNWLAMLMPFFLIFFYFWSTPSRLSTWQNYLTNYMMDQLQISLKTKKDGSQLIFLVLFWFVLMSNLMGLVPNVFTSTSHLTTNLFMSIPLWLGFILFGWITFTNNMLAHLVPLGTPSPLISFMVLIELISTMIRPFTLAIRLMANMVSGHLLMTLMGNTMQQTSLLLLPLLVLTQTALFILETGVAMIQAYVFCMLTTLYSDDSDYNVVT